MKKRLIIAITGASGAAYGVRMLQLLSQFGDWETHLVMSSSGALTAAHEVGMRRSEIEALAAVIHNVRDIGASIASGSFQCDGMVIAPCSMRTLAAVAHGLADNLIARAADVMLKERRRLVLLARETPLNLAHLRNMTAVTEMGGDRFPAGAGFLQSATHDRRYRESYRRSSAGSVQRRARWVGAALARTETIRYSGRRPGN